VAYPLSYKVIQVTDSRPIAGMKLERLWGHEQDLLRGVFVNVTPQVVVEPKAHKEEKPVTIEKTTKAVIVLGNFCKTSGSCFYHVEPFDGKSLVIDLTADASCFVSNKR